LILTYVEVYENVANLFEAKFLWFLLDKFVIFRQLWSYNFRYFPLLILIRTNMSVIFWSVNERMRTLQRRCVSGILIVKSYFLMLEDHRCFLLLSSLSCSVHYYYFLNRNECDTFKKTFRYLEITNILEICPWFVGFGF
jgi:hypothetical protein